MSVEIRVEDTPNPASKKFVTNQNVASTTRWYGSADDVGDDTLARALFELDGVANVMMLNDFVTVGKTDDTDWSDLADDVVSTLKEHLG